MIDDKTIFSTLKKCNQIGKKLSNNGVYLMVSGMMIGYSEQQMDETEAQGLGISFIENKLLSKLDAIPYIGLKIDGNQLYQYSQEYDFEKFSISNEYLNIEFKATEATDEDFNNDFKKDALKKGYNENSIDIGISNNFSNDIDLYEFYLNYKKTYKPKVKILTKSVKCKIIDYDNKILKKANSIISSLEKCTFLGYKELQPEIFDRMISSTQPVDMKIPIGDNKNDSYPIRLMKSLFNTASTKSSCELRLVDADIYKYLIIEITNSGFITCMIYKVIDL